MIHNILRALAVVLVLCTAACDSQEDDFTVSTSDQTKLLPSMKGYELYSWETDGQWSYTLITGTNRTKAYEEIVSPDNIESDEWVKISVHDLESLKTLLRRVPSKEYISWISTSSRVSGFMLPESMIVMQIKRHCNALNLNLEVVD